MNRDEQALIEDNRQYDISRANESIRGQLSAGIAVEDVAKSLNTPDGMEPGLVLGAMSIAENYKINPGEAMAIAPSVFKQTHGDKYDLNDIIKDYYAKPADYELPFKHKTLAEFDAEIEQEETTGVKAYKQRKRQPNPLGGFFAFGGFNQALVREDIVRQQIDDKTWFQDNASKEKFVKSMITAETDEQKADLRRERLVDMISEQVDRAQSLRDMERKRKVLAEDSPGQWLSKYYAGARGVSRLRMSSYQAAGEALDILGSIAESGSLKSLSEDMNKMARGYWKAMQEPEVTPLAVNSFDRAVNSFLENVPHVGLTVLESVIVPPATPLFVFFNSTALEGTMIRQQALDAGFSEESSRVRGWIGGTVNGLIESIGGGAGKYTPKNLLSKIAKFPGKLTNNALKEIFMEEIPQEVVSMMLTNDVPHNADGTLDWDAITDRMISLAGDTAFASAMFTAGGSALGQYGEWSRGKKINKQFAHDMQIVMDNVRKAAEKATEAPATGITPAEGTITPAEAKGKGVPKELPTEKAIDLPKVQLFHNTDRASAESILKSGFELDDISGLSKAEKSLVVGNLGDGVYLSPNLEENMNVNGGDSNLTITPKRPLKLFSLGSEEGAASITLEKVDEIKEQGYDGIIVNDPHPRSGGYQVVVFDPKLLKVENIVEDIEQPPAEAKGKGGVDVDGVSIKPTVIKESEIVRDKFFDTIETKDLPPVKEGDIRLYRGQSPIPREGAGRFYTPFLNHAYSYAQEQGKDWEITYIDLPKEIANKYASTKINKEDLGMENIAREYLFPQLATPAKAEAAKRIISEEAYQKAKDYLTDTTRMSMGIDPEGFKHLVTAGAYWVETGIRDFAAWSKKMIDEYGPKIKPALHDIWQQVNPEKADDELTIKAPADDADITELVASAPSYGLQLQPDGKYAVMDWDTQQEVKSGLSEKYAANLAGQYNKGLIDPPKRRLRDNLPTSQDIETLTHGQLLNVVFKKVSQESRKAVRESVDSIITMHKDLISYARIALDKFDLTKGQQSKLLNKIALAATDKQKSDAVATIEAIREIARHSKAFSEFKKFRSLINRASNKKLSDGGIHWKVYEQLQELLNNYTTLSPKILNSIKRTDEYLDRLRENASENYSSDYAEALIPRTVIAKLQELSSTRIQDMSAEQLESLNSSIGHLLKQSQLWDKLSTSRKVNQMRDFLGNAVDRIDLKEKPGQVKRLRKKKWLFGRAWDAFLGYRNDDIYTIFSRIYGKFDPLTIDTMRMRDNQTEIALKLNDMVTSVIDELGITTDQLSAWSPNMQLFDIGQAAKERLGTSATLYPVKIGDTAHQFFMSEIMVMYMHSKNAYNLNKIVKNGIGTYDLGIVGKLTQDEFTEMLSIIDQDPTARAFCDGLANLYIETARLGNEVSRELDGINLFNEDDYFHIEYVPEGGVIGTEYLRDAIVDEEGRLQPRTSSNRAVILRDIFEIVAVDINVMSNFIGMTEQLRKLRSLANYGPFRDKIRNAQKEDLLKAIDTRIGEVQRTRQPPSGTLDKAVQRLGRGAARASLTMPTVWLYQPMSAVLYTTETSDKYLLNMGWLSSGFEKELLQNWTLYRARKEGMSGSKSIASRGSIRKRFTGKNSPVDTQLAGLHKGDIWGVSRAALVTRAEMADTRMSGKSLEWWQAYGVEPTSLEYGSEQYWEAFKDRANYLVTLTQPMFFSENKGEYANSTNPIVREAARFRSFVDQTLRIMHRQAAFAAKGDQSAAASAKNIAITLLVLSVWKSLVKYEWDKHIMGKDKELDDLLRDILTSPAQLIPFLGYPASKIAQVALGADNLSVQSPSYSMVATMLVDNMLAHSYDMARGINYAMDDEYFQSGPNAGESKADVYLRRGIKGAFQDYLVLQGVPAYVIDQVQWYKD